MELAQTLLFFSTATNRKLGGAWGRGLSWGRNWETSCTISFQSLSSGFWEQWRHLRRKKPWSWRMFLAGKWERVCITQTGGYRRCPVNWRISSTHSHTTSLDSFLPSLAYWRKLRHCSWSLLVLVVVCSHTRMFVAHVKWRQLPSVHVSDSFSADSWINRGN